MERRNPWLSIWFQTRATVREAIDSSNEKLAILAAVTAGIVQALDQASQNAQGDGLPMFTIFIIAIFAGILSGLFAYYVVSALLRWIGSWLGGQGSYHDVRISVGYAAIPSALSMGLWVILLLFYGKENFTTLTPKMDSSWTLILLYLGITIIKLVIGIFTIIISCKTLGEAHGFSAWKGLLTYFILIVIMIVVILIALFLISVLFF